MSIKINEGGKKGGRVPKEAQFVIATSPPVARGGLRPGANGKSRPKPKAKSRAGRRPPRGRARQHRSLDCFNAFSKRSLGLPRAVGDYTYITTIENIPIAGTANQQLWCFIPLTYRTTGNQGLNFTSPIAWNSNHLGVAGAPTAGMQIYQSKAVADAMGGGVELVPAAMTVRVTCPTPLQSATGQYFLGKWNIAADPREYLTFSDMVSGFMSYGQPRPLTAARLAMRGVQCSAIPRNMSDCSEFLHAEPNGGASGIQTLAPYPLTDPIGTFSGLSPIFLIVEGNVSSATSLNVQVAIKWRYRFNMNNPAAKTHTYQPITSDSVWNEMCRVGSEAVHGVESIPEAVEAFF